MNEEKEIIQPNHLKSHSFPLKKKPLEDSQVKAISGSFVTDDHIEWPIAKQYLLGIK